MDYNNKNKPFDLEKIYGSAFIDKKDSGYYPSLVNDKKPLFKSNFIVDSVIFYLQERLSIDTVIKELSFSLVAIITFIYMHHSGRIINLGEFGIIINFMLIAALSYNFFKASFHSLTPGLLCLVGGLVLLSSTIHQQYFKYISVQSIDYIIGAGAFFIALSLFKSKSE